LIKQVSLTDLQKYYFSKYFKFSKVKKMERLQFRFILTAVILFSLMTAATLNAAPVKFNQVVQVVNAKPGKADNGGFAQLRLGGEIIIFSDNDNDNDKNKKKEATRPQQDDRVITETSVEIVEEEVCDCEDIPVTGGRFPYWALGFAAIPFLFLIPPDRDRDRTPTPTPSETPTPGMTPTPTPTPTPTETPTPTPTPTMTPTPPPEPIPEPMTILLFGTGLAGVGLAARRRFGKKRKQEESED
jgi:hypothetical protein